jgi:hypothetical protein
MMSALLLLLLQGEADEATKKLVDAYRAKITALVQQTASPKIKIDEALAAAAKFDERAVEELSAKLKVTPDEIKAAWAKREKKPKKVAAGDGSWIFLGGQDGGLDSAVKGTPVQERDIADDLIDRNPSVLTKRKPKPPPEPVPLGKPLKTKDEWWTTSSVDERRALVEAEWARKSAAVEKSEDTKDCPTCKGKGALNVNRGGIGLSAVCARCHGAKSDLTVVHE